MLRRIVDVSRDRSLLGERLVLLANLRRLEEFFGLDRDDNAGGGLAGVRDRCEDDFVVGGGRGGVRFLKRLFIGIFLVYSRFLNVQRSLVICVCHGY